MSARRIIVVLASSLVGCGALGIDPPDGGSGSAGGTSGSGGAGGTSGTGPVGWRAIPLPAADQEARVTGVHCSSRSSCVIATHPLGDYGKVYAASESSVGAVLVSGATVEPLAHVSGTPGFLGFERTREGLTARLTVSGAYVTDKGELTQVSSWQVAELGRVEGSTFPLNAQESLQVAADGTWRFINNRGYLYGATSAPSATTAWTRLWSPTASPSVPSDFAARKSADPSLCHSDLTTGTSPKQTQNVWMSQDLALIVHPSRGLGQAGTSAPGVCISTDRGASFHTVPFADAPTTVTEPGPTAVTCLDTNRCFALGGLEFQLGSVFIYRTENASMGVSSTWVRATLPQGISSATDVSLSAIFFAPDGQHGWTVGTKARKGLLLRTKDGGKTWEDVSNGPLAITTQRLHTGFALDQDVVWLGGEKGALLFTNAASQ